jgi:V/A-type H+-transporting ATPase subunit A
MIGLLAEADRLGELAELDGAATQPRRERVVLLAGRLLREGVLQQNALIPNDAHCTAEKTAALVDAVLAVIDECTALIDRGAIATEIEELDFSAILRAAQESPPDGVDAVAAHREQMLAILAGVR